MESAMQEADKREFARIGKVFLVNYEIRNMLNKTISQGRTTTSNISLGGLQLYVAQPITTNEQVELEIHLNRFSKIRALSKVIWCKKNRNDYEVGLEFTRLPEEHSKTLLDSFIPKYS